LRPSMAKHSNYFQPQQTLGVLSLRAFWLCLGNYVPPAQPRFGKIVWKLLGADTVLPRLFSFQKNLASSVPLPLLYPPPSPLLSP
jgi:hypothetical protein